MSALDHILEGDEPVVQSMIAAMGYIHAKDFRRSFNNACMQMAGFERPMAALHGHPDVFLVPVNSYSHRDDH